MSQQATAVLRILKNEVAEVTPIIFPHPSYHYGYLLHTLAERRRTTAEL